MRQPRELPCGPFRPQNGLKFEVFRDIINTKERISPAREGLWVAPASEIFIVFTDAAKTPHDFHSRLNFKVKIYSTRSNTGDSSLTTIQHIQGFANNVVDGFSRSASVFFSSRK